MKKNLTLIMIFFVIALFVLLINVPNTSYAMTTISNVYVSSLDEPEAGKIPDTTATAGKGYSVYSVDWYDETSSRFLEEGDKFIAGHKYYVQVWVEADNNYQFNYTNSYTPNVTGYINNAVAEVAKAYEYSAWAMVTLTYHYDLTIIKKIEITGGALPKIGEICPTKNDWGVPDNCHYTKSDTYYWYNVTDNKDPEPYNAFEFQAGKVYRVTFSFTPNYMYSFADPSKMTAVLTNFSSNNYSVSITAGGINNASRLVKITFNKLTSNEIKITNVSINGGAFPVEGENPDYSWSVSSGVHYSIYGTPYWNSPNEHRHLEPTDTFVYGQTYNLTITLIPDVGYCFDNVNNINVTLVNINDEYHANVSNSDHGITLWIAMTTKRPTYTVRFETGDLGSYVPSQFVQKGEKATKPDPDPTSSDGRQFVNWYENSRYSKLWDFNTPITGDKTLYAKFSENAGQSGVVNSVSISTGTNIYYPFLNDNVYIPTIDIDSVSPESLRNCIDVKAYWYVGADTPTPTTIYPEDLENNIIKFNSGRYTMYVSIESNSNDVTVNHNNFPEKITLGNMEFKMDGWFDSYVVYSRTFQVIEFTDVVPLKWYVPSVEHVFRNQLITGYGNGETFGPNDNITRGMIVTILWRNSGKPESSYDMNFSDVTDSKKWYYDAVRWAAENGIVTGYASGPNAGKFMPDVNITREQIALILQRYAAYMGKDSVTQGNINVFSDYAKVSNYAKDAMKWAVGTGIIKGNADGTLNPLGQATRAEFATMIMRFLEDLPFAT